MSPAEVLAMGMDIAPQLTPPLSQGSHVKGDQAEQNLQIQCFFCFFFPLFLSPSQNTQRGVNHDCYMSTCKPSANPLLWFSDHMRGSRSWYGKLCDLRSARLLRSVWTAGVLPPFSPRPPPVQPLMLNTALYFSLVIVCSFHRLTGGLITWRQTNLRLLYISCESPGEPCLQKPETRTLRKTARRELVLFFFFFFFFLLNFHQGSWDIHALSESGGGLLLAV